MKTPLTYAAGLGGLVMADGVAGKKDFVITCAEDCGNAPKKELLKKLHIAMAGMEAQFMNENFTDGIQLNYVGERSLHGNDHGVERTLICGNFFSSYYLFGLH